MLETRAAQTMSFEAPLDFAEETRLLAENSNKPVSEYIREAVREKNERELVERMRMLSERLSARSLLENQAMDDSLGDGLA